MEYESNISFNIEEKEDFNDGKRINIRLEIPFSYGFINNPNFVVQSYNNFIRYPLRYIKCENNKAIFEGNIYLKTSALYKYYFEYEANSKKKYLIRNNYFSDTLEEENLFKLSVNFEVPSWANGAVMYHIFVDRFKRGSEDKAVPLRNRFVYDNFESDMLVGPNSEGIWNTDFYAGDLKGIEQSLEYIKSLGVDILYLSPIFKSQSNHRYDTADYEEVDVYVGKNEDLIVLCDKAHSMGMRVILDAVFNHTGNDSIYFNEYGTYNTIGAFQSEKSPYYNFYRKNNGKFEYWWGMKNLPVCDGNSSDWKDYILGEGGIIDKWFSLGIDGLRLDVADELSDQFIEGIRKAVKRNKKDGLIIGEVWKNPMNMGRGYISNGKCMDSVMNYYLIDALIRYFKYADVEKLKMVVNDIKQYYPEGTINTLMNFTSTHDISRLITIFGANCFSENSEWVWNPTNNDLKYCKDFHLDDDSYKLGRDILESYMFLLTFMPGIISIFYGDEIGIEGLGNLANIKPFVFDKRDENLLKFYRYLGKIRKEQPFLHKADFNLFDITKEYIMLERKTQEESLLTIVNRTNFDRKIYIPNEYEKESVLYDLRGSNKNEIKRYGGITLKKELK